MVGCKNTIIPNTVNRIGSYAFEGCLGLTNITIPNSVTRIDGFSGSGLTSVVIPNSATYIGPSAFDGCLSLKSVYIPNSLTDILGSPFYNCNNLTSVFVDNSTPPYMGYGFSNYANATLYVPKGSRDAYLGTGTGGWQDFKEIIELDNVNRVLLTETSKVAPVAANNVDVHVTRTINAGEWGTICLPFTMTNAQLKAAFGNGVKLKEFKGYSVNGENIIVKFATVTSLEANHPYIIKVTDAVSSFLVDGVNIVESNDPRVHYEKDGKQQDFVGTLVGGFNFYEAATNIPIFLSGGIFWFASETTQGMNAFRGYFDFGDCPKGGSSNARFIMEFVDEEPTAISTTLKDNEKDNEVYDLQGRVVRDSQLKPGLYLRNGKKTIIR